MTAPDVVPEEAADAPPEVPAAAAPAPARTAFPHWPGPPGPAPLPLIGTVTGVGAVAATALPDGPTGVGWSMTAAVAVAATILVRRAANRVERFAPTRPLLPADVGWTVLALALATVPAVRAAAWLAVLCLLAAGAAAALAVAGRSVPTLTGSLALPAVAALRAVPWLGRGLRRRRVPARVLPAGLAGVAVLLVFVPLLSSADAAFAAVVAQVTPAVQVDALTRWVVLFCLAAAAVAGAAFVLLGPPEPVERDARATRLRCLDWALPTGLLVAVLAVFVGVQFAVLFGGDDHVLRTTGLTYAEYARGGFWQLLTVTALALGVLAFDSRWAPERTPTDRAVKRGLLAALAVLTLVVVASALHRMALYQQAYGYTVLRLVVLTCELWLGAGFVLALVAVLRLRPAGMSRPMVAAGMLALLGLAVLDPERLVAERNVARWTETGSLDTSYLSGLSADAVPALVALPPRLRDCPLAGAGAGLDDPDDWRSANRSREVARAVLAEARPSCAAFAP